MTELKTITASNIPFINKKMIFSLKNTYPKK